MFITIITFSRLSSLGSSRQVCQLYTKVSL